jgi:acyl carrier protein
MQQLIKDYLINQARVSPDKLADPNIKISELGIDSLGVIELLFEVEEKYGFQIENPMEFANMTIDEIAAAVEKTLAEKNAAGAVPSA